VRVIIAALMGVSLTAALALAEEPRSVPESAASAAEREKVQSAQVLLHILGFYDGSTNGTLGPVTRKAIAAYQEKLGLPATGTPDDRTLFAMANPGAVKACSTGTAPVAVCLDNGMRSVARGGNAPAAPAATSASREGDGNPCADPKLPLEQCLQALAKIDGFMKARGLAKK
jgi:peptidoglycan hydrolase-like protein with peptidoglycan-binding domain